MLRLIVQTKRRYKTKNEKETKEKSTKGTENKRKVTLFAQQMKKQGKALNKAQTKTKTVMYHSMKMKTKKLTNAKQQKTGLNSSYEGTREAEEHMKKTNIPCWIETHRRMR